MDTNDNPAEIARDFSEMLATQGWKRTEKLINRQIADMQEKIESSAINGEMNPTLYISNILAIKMLRELRDAPARRLKSAKKRVAERTA